MSSVRTLFTLLFVVALFNSTPAQGYASIDGFQDIAATTPSVLHSQDCEGDDPEYLLCSSPAVAIVRTTQDLQATVQAKCLRSVKGFHARAPPAYL